MPKPAKQNAIIENCIAHWNTGKYTFALVNNSGAKGGYIVRVWPHDKRESFWLDGNWETESGAAWSILNYLDDLNEE